MIEIEKIINEWGPGLAPIVIELIKTILNKPNSFTEDDIKKIARKVLIEKKTEPTTINYDELAQRMCEYFKENPHLLKLPKDQISVNKTDINDRTHNKKPFLSPKVDFDFNSIVLKCSSTPNYFGSSDCKKLKILDIKNKSYEYLQDFQLSTPLGEIYCLIEYDDIKSHNFVVSHSLIIQSGAIKKIIVVTTPIKKGLKLLFYLSNSDKIIHNEILTFDKPFFLKE